MAIAPLRDIVSAEFKADPFPFYAQLRQQAPVFRAKITGRKNPRPSQIVWLVTRYQDVVDLLRDERFLKNKRTALSGQPSKAMWIPAFARPLEKNMLDLDPPDHRRLRNLVQLAFTPKQIQRLENRIEEIADQLISDMAQQSSADLLKQFALPLPLTVICELLGVPAKDQHKFHHWTAKILGAPSGWNMIRAIPSLMALLRYLRKLFNDKRSDPQDDLMSALVQVESDGDQLSSDELTGMAFLLLVAGHETTVNLIATGMLELLQARDQFEILSAQPDLIDSAIEELLRFASPVETSTERYAREDLTLHDVQIRKGDMTLGVLASANRDSDEFDNPDQLDITRSPNRHLSFGHGIHFCLGASLARLESRIAFAKLLRRFPGLQLSVPRHQLRWRSAFVLRGLESLPVKL